MPGTPPPSQKRYDYLASRETRIPHMADRKQFENVPTPNPELVRLLDEARGKPVTEEELQEQRISFAFGNAPFSSERITKDSVRESSKCISLKC